MDVKIIFFKRDLKEEIYMKQSKGFISNGNNHLICKFKKSIHG